LVISCSDKLTTNKYGKFLSVICSRRDAERSCGAGVPPVEQTSVGAERKLREFVN